LIASPEEVLQAKVRELDHVLLEALDRLADADQRITQLEAEATSFRDNVLPVMEKRIATIERLTVTSFVNQESLAATQSGVPLSGKVSDTNFPRESVVRNGRRGKGRSDNRDTNNHKIGEYLETSSNTEDVSYYSDEVTHTLGLSIKRKAVPGLNEIIPARSDYTHLVSYRSYFQAGSWVYVRKEFHATGTKPKLDAQADGPYRVLETDSHTFKIQQGEQKVRISSNRITPAPAPPGEIRPGTLITSTSIPVTASDDVSVNDEENHAGNPEHEAEYVMERIFGVRQGADGKLRYRIRWYGNGRDDYTWEPLEHLPEDLVRRYHRRTRLHCSH
jgi:hypothetical protein